MRNAPRGRLELTWMGKDQALIPTVESTYDYTWVDPRDPRACQTHYLVDEGHVGDPEDGGIHDNLLITGESGDVLEALTRVPELAERYVGRVKCVYIDPPFNTEKTFAHYEDNLEHSVWLTLMRDRLVLLKKLLAEDGSIWVHLDDGEVHRMRVLLDEVFGAANFVATVIWQKAYSPRNDAAGFSTDQDYILIYSLAPEWKVNRLPRLASRDALYTSPDGDPEPWVSGDPAAPGAGRGSRQHPGVYAIQNPVTGEMIYPARGRVWSNAQTTVIEMLAKTASYELAEPDLEARSRAAGIPLSRLRQDVKDLHVVGELLSDSDDIYVGRPLPRLYFTKGGRGGLKMKKYLSEVASDRSPQTLWLTDEVGHSRSAKNEIRTLFPGVTPFDTPKPEALLEKVLQIATNPGDIVLDCFAGSGTTAAVAHKMGRRWVTCELLPETVAKFTRPRLDKVVAGQDAGGITARAEFEAVNGLPGATTVDEARTFTTVLGRVLKSLGEYDGQDGDALDTDDEIELSELDADTIAQVKAVANVLKAATKTRKVATVQWQGGGGFDVARLSPDWVGVDVDTVSGTPDAFLLPEATGEVLGRSVAAHLGFRYLPDNPRFSGHKGRQWLAVVEGMFTPALLEEFVADIPDGDALTVCCYGAGEGMDRRLRRCATGSRLLVIPEDLFTLNNWEV